MLLYNANRAITHLIINALSYYLEIIAYYPVMAPMPQWELSHTKVEQAHRTVGL